jgi:hypothetical protein
MNKGGTVFDSWEVRKRLRKAYPLLVNENPAVDPIGEITHIDRTGEVTIEINNGIIPALTLGQKDDIKSEISSWTEFYQFDDDSQ